MSEEPKHHTKLRVAGALAMVLGAIISGIGQAADFGLVGMTIPLVVRTIAVAGGLVGAGLYAAGWLADTLQFRN